MAAALLSLSEKLALTIVVWLIAAFVSIPLWDLADVLFHAYRDKSLSRAVVDVFLSPGGTLLGLGLMFGATAEHGFEPIAERYWPAVLIASTFTVFTMRRWWWRRG